MTLTPLAASRRLRVSLLALPLALLLTGCVGSTTDVARDPAPSPSPTSTTGPNLEVSLGLPAQVRTRDLVTIIDKGDGEGPQVCLGPIAAIYPPICSGPPVLGWSWKRNPMHNQEGSTRWGSFLVTGTWDGQALTATEPAIPAALYDPAFVEPTEPAKPTQPRTAAQLADVADEVEQLLPGVRGVYAGDDHVHVDVYYDNGALQAWADETYGTNTVLISSELVGFAD